MKENMNKKIVCEYEGRKEYGDLSFKKGKDAPGKKDFKEGKNE
jgi:hypothetical protein